MIQFAGFQREISHFNIQIVTGGPGRIQDYRAGGVHGIGIGQSNIPDRAGILFKLVRVQDESSGEISGTHAQGGDKVVAFCFSSPPDFLVSVAGTAAGIAFAFVFVLNCHDYKPFMDLMDYMDIMDVILATDIYRLYFSYPRIFH